MAEQVIDNQKFTGVRLPTTYKPIHYTLSLRPDLDNFTFEGTVKIDYALTDRPDYVPTDRPASPARSLVLHAHELEITEGYVQSNYDIAKIHTLSKVTYSRDSETATLEFTNVLFNRGVLSLHFKGTLNDKMRGFYRTEFTYEGKTVHAATTQFEATYARMCFPCWDEPAFKATFTVVLSYKDRNTATGLRNEALSNMPIQKRLFTSEGESEMTYEMTPKMPTYLLAFVVGPFAMIEKSDGKRPIRVYTTPGKSHHGQFALDVACKSLAYYEDYFGIEYPLPKMDLIAIPDFSSGAMENWGLVTYRETCILVDPNNTETSRKQNVALVVAHELAHQWFGNLVTMEWWTHLWLNEGFATFMEYLCVDHIFPEYDIWPQFVTSTYSVALDLDSLHNSHPIEVPVKHPSEIDEIFDHISYNKGASVIRMLYNYIGDENFRKGMKSYLLKFSYKNACTEDLWQALEEASDKPICKLMSGWTSQKGFPWLSVSSASVGNKTELTLTQSKFTSDGILLPDEADVNWVIPVAAISKSDIEKPVAATLLDGKTGKLTVDESGDSWIKLNPGSISLYRTAYPEDMTKRLILAIGDQSLPPVDRLGLQDDFFALCQAGKVKTVDLLKFLNAFKGETSYTVWESIDQCLGYINILLANTNFQDKFHLFGRCLYSEIFKKTTWSAQPNEKHTDAMLRTLVINRLVSFGDKDVIEEAKLKFKTCIEDKVDIPADLRGAVYRAISAHGEDDAFEGLFKIYRTSELQEEKNRVHRALGSAKDAARLERGIKFMLSDEVKFQDKFITFVTLGMAKPPLAWKLFQEHKEMLKEKYACGHILPMIVKYVTENFADDEKAQEIAKFFEENKFPSAERTVQQSLEAIRIKRDWLARDSESIKTFLSTDL